MFSFFKNQIIKKIFTKNTYFLSQNIQESFYFFKKNIELNPSKKVIFSSTPVSFSNIYTIELGKDTLELPFLFFYRSVFYHFVSSFLEKVLFNDHFSSNDRDRLTTLLFKQHEKFLFLEECSLYDFFHLILQKEDDYSSKDIVYIQKIQQFIEKEDSFFKSIIFTKKIQKSYFLFDEYSYCIFSTNNIHQKIISILFSATIFDFQNKMIQNFQTNKKPIYFYFFHFCFEPDIEPYDNNILLPNSNYFFYIFENQISKNLNLNNFYSLFISLEYLFSHPIESNNLVRLLFLPSEILLLYSQIYQSLYIHSSFHKNKLFFLKNLTIYNFKT
jgi:hypothetical protein